MSRNEFLLALLLAAVLLAGTLYETIRGGDKTAQVLVTREQTLPIESDPAAVTPALQPPESNPLTPAPDAPPQTLDPALNFINQANMTELMAVSGIGTTYASRIIEVRERLTRFNSPEEVMKVKGVGPALWQAIEEHATQRQYRPTPVPSPVQNFNPRLNNTRNPIQLLNTGMTRLNLNQAGKEDLVKVPGIGDTLAERLIHARARQRGFRQWDDIRDINGFGDSRLATLQEHFFLPGE